MVFLFILALVAVLGFIISQRRAEKVEPAPTPKAALMAPVFPTVTASQPSYSSALSPPAFPASVQLYQTGGPAANYSSKFSGVAEGLGFTGDPKIIVISRGNFSIWNKGSASLSLGGDPLEVSYGSGLTPAGTVSLSQDAIDRAARAFIQKAGVVSPGITLEKKSFDYFSPKGSLLNPQADPSKATLVQINYRYLLDNRPLYTRQANTPSFSVGINSLGQVVSLSGYWFLGITRGAGTVDLLNYQAALSKLTGGQGSLVSLSSAQNFNSEGVPQYSLSSSAIREVVLGYYYSANQGVLTPVYVFNGSGLDNVTGFSVDTVTLVSALP